MVYDFATSAAAGPLMTGALGTAHCGGGSVTVMNAEALAPPLAGGSAALMFVLPTATPVAPKFADDETAGMTTVGCTVAMAGFDEVSDTVVAAPTALLACTVKIVESLTFTERLPGR